MVFGVFASLPTSFLHFRMREKSALVLSGVGAIKGFALGRVNMMNRACGQEVSGFRVE